jgi:hypothetical protein
MQAGQRGACAVLPAVACAGVGVGSRTRPLQAMECPQACAFHPLPPQEQKTEWFQQGTHGPLSCRAPRSMFPLGHHNCCIAHGRITSSLRWWRCLCLCSVLDPTGAGTSCSRLCQLCSRQDCVEPLQQCIKTPLQHACQCILRRRNGRLCCLLPSWRHSPRVWRCLAACHSSAHLEAVQQVRVRDLVLERGNLFGCQRHR